MNQPCHNSIRDLYITAALEHGPSPAILSGDGAFLTYDALRDFCRDTANILNNSGVNARDRIAIFLPGGPVMAVAFLAITSCAASVPLNPNSKKDELLSALKDLKCTALLLLKDAPSPARDAAREIGLPLIEVSPDDKKNTCGTLHIFPFKLREKNAADPPCGQDIALLLHTSGTTSRPKVVPLTHHNIIQSVHNIIHSLALTPRDRALNVMPLFHIHGIMVCLLSPLASGGSVICTEIVQFTPCLDSLKPTWYSAVPTMHQAILRSQRAISPTTHHKWRFIRSSSAALAPALMAHMADYYHCPIIEAYGMTEASHLIASNPLQNAKAGSVGRAAGPDLALLSGDGAIIQGTGDGEIIIRGENVMKAYENNPPANAENFVKGWFRTGDLGRIDDQGYLCLTGRIKEIINCGGEKIMPREIDEILLEHDAVREAVTFAAPHSSLGEQPAAALVLEDGKTVKKEEIRAFVGQRLAALKIPQIIIFLDQLPKGPTGKLQRRGLADILLVPHRQKMPHAENMTKTERDIHTIWRNILERDDMALDDRFLEIGGDSLSAIEVMLQIEENHHINISLDDLFNLPTIRQLAQYVQKQKTALL